MKDREKHSITPFYKWVGANYTINEWRGGGVIYRSKNELDNELYLFWELKDKYIEYLEYKNKEYYKFSRN